MEKIIGDYDLDFFFFLFFAVCKNIWGERALKDACTFFLQTLYFEKQVYSTRQAIKINHNKAIQLLELS